MNRKLSGLTKRHPWQDELLALETQLLDPTVRGNAAKLDMLLGDEFVEFGSSGRVYDKAMLIEMLAGETHAPVLMKDFAVRLVGDDTALVTYRSVGQSGQEARRSSIWARTDEGWKMAFHQGTRIPNSWGNVR